MPEITWVTVTPDLWSLAIAGTCIGLLIAAVTAILEEVMNHA